MDWLNLHASTLDSPEFVGAKPAQRSTWLCLLRFCIGQENGGRIVSANTWGDRRWQQLVRVTLREIKDGCELWRIDGDDIEVNFYPVAKQREIETKRQAGRDTVAKRWEKRPCSADSSATSSAHSSGSSSADTEGELERNRKGNRNTPIAPLAGGEALDLKIEGSPPASTPLAEKLPRTKSATQLRVEALMRRRPLTPLGPGEGKAYRRALPAIEATTPEDWTALEAFYAAPQPETFARKDLPALLNNWNGEIDRAKTWFAASGKSNARPTWALPGEEVI